MGYEGATCEFILWDLPGDKTIVFPDSQLDNLLQQGVDIYDLEEISNLFQCNVTLVRTTKETYQREG